MDSSNRYDGIDIYVANLIKYKAKQLVGHYGFTLSDIEDLEQEMMLEYLRRVEKYDSNRASLKTFAARIIENIIANIVEKQNADKREYSLTACSLNDPIKDENGESFEIGETVDQDTYFRRTGLSQISAHERLILSIDNRAFLDTLPPNLRKIADLLKQEDIAEIVKMTGIPRTTIYELIKKLRRLASEFGLNDKK